MPIYFLRGSHTGHFQQQKLVHEKQTKRYQKVVLE